MHMCGFPQTENEFKNTYLTYTTDDQRNFTSKLHDFSEYPTDMPSSMDWRSKGAVGAVKDQVAH